MYTLKLTRELINNCTQPGVDAEDDVRHWLAEPRIKNQIDAIPTDYIREYLKECGAWDTEELEDNDMNQVRLLWVSANDAKEQIYRKEQAPCTVYISH